MLILALDTTTRDGSLAILRGREVLQQLVGDPALTHGQRLPGDIDRICETAGVPLREIELFAVAAGPGSFTGLRVGIAAVQGLAFARHQQVVPVTTLEALAESATTPGAVVAAWMDAQRGEVYASLYEHPADENEAGRIIFDAAHGSPEDILSAWLKERDLRGVEFHGDGAVRYAARIHAVLGDYVRVAAVVPPLAPAIGRIAAREPHRAVVPHAIQPVYVRRPDAELARDRRTSSA